MTFLVTGAAGFIGSHSVDRLLAAGERVVGLDNFSSGRRANLEAAFKSPLFSCVEADIRNHAAIERLFDEYGFSGVLHLAALVSVPLSVQDPQLNFEINVAATDALARLCVKKGCRRLVFASSAAVYGAAEQFPITEAAPLRPISPYGAAKLAGENMLSGYAAAFGLEAVCFRNFNVYGPRQDPASPYSGVLSIFADRYRAGVPVTIYGDGEQTRDFVAVRDVAEANVRALTHAGPFAGIFNVCTGTAISINELVGRFAELYPGSAAPQLAPGRSGDIRHSLGDCTSLERCLKFRPAIPFEQGLAELVNL